MDPRAQQYAQPGPFSPQPQFVYVQDQARIGGRRGGTRSNNNQQTQQQMQKLTKAVESLAKAQTSKSGAKKEKSQQQVKKAQKEYPGYHSHGGKYYKNSDGVSGKDLAEAFSKLEVKSNEI